MTPLDVDEPAQDSRRAGEGSGVWRMSDDGVSPARDGGIVLIASLFIYPGKEAEFRQFEAQAAGIMRHFGGEIERVIRPHDAAGGAERPHEVHVVCFPSMEQFEAYRQDPDLAALAPLRASVIARTEVLIGDVVAGYG